MKKLALVVSLVFLNFSLALGQTKAPPKTTAPAPQTGQAAPTGPEAVRTAFNKLLEGIRRADVKLVTDVYWNSPQLNLFNYNGTVTKGWEQMRKNRESSYPEIKDVKLEVRDVNVTMLGVNAALVTCVWTQSQNYKGTPETAAGRMTLVFRKVGPAWKAIHLHSSPDQPNPAVIPPSEQQQPAAAPTPSPTPAPAVTEKRARRNKKPSTIESWTAFGELLGLA